MQRNVTEFIILVLVCAHVLYNDYIIITTSIITPCIHINRIILWLTYVTCEFEQEFEVELKETKRTELRKKIVLTEIAMNWN